jgi:uncharacterized protein (TIGR00730 family)
MNICYFCASSEDIAQKYRQTAQIIGRLTAQKKHTLITGGSNIGLMRTLVKSATEFGGRTIGIIPVFFENRGLACYDNSKLIIVNNMHERKQKLFEISDAFVILPGGYGTLDEMLEIITLKQIGIYDKPIIIFNQDGYYDPILQQFEKMHSEKFSNYGSKNAYFVTSNTNEIFDIIESPVNI